MNKLVAILMTSLALSACVTAPVPANYTGPIARIQDSAISETPSRAQFYYLREIGGQKVDNVLFETRKVNNGRGFSQTVSSFEREVPAGPSTLQLRATIGYGAPIQEIANSTTMYSIEKVISFTIQPYKTYVVKGTLTAEKQDVWLEDFFTGQRVN
jgi:hypothetical protein